MEAWPNLRVGARVRVVRTVEAWPDVRVRLGNLAAVAAAAGSAVLAAAEGDPDPWKHLRDVPDVLSRPATEPPPAPVRSGDVRSGGIRSGGIRSGGVRSGGVGGRR